MTTFMTASMRGFQNTSGGDRQHPRPTQPKLGTVYPKRAHEITGTLCLGWQSA